MSSLENTNPWAPVTANFIYGCQRISEGCDNCYIDRRPWNLQLEKYRMKTPFDAKVHYFDEERQIKKIDSFPENSIIWTNGLGDTFAEFIPDRKRDRWHEIFESRPQYQFVICTKRAGVMLNYYKSRKVPDNLWLGVTVEMRRYIPRIELLKKVRAKIRWISFEPLLEDLRDIDLKGIRWASVGGETDPHGKFHTFNSEWAWNLKLLCERYSVRFWYEGGNGFSDARRIDGGLLHGKRYQEYPPFNLSKQSTLN